MTSKINGIDTDALKATMEAIRQDHAKGMARFNVTTAWMGGTRSETRVENWGLGGQVLPKNFTIRIDEPPELLGTNTAANPQEYLMAAMNACIMATWVAACSMQGIELESLEIDSCGELDLRGFLGLDKKIKPGYDEIEYTVRIKGNGTPEQYAAVHRWVEATSPNYFNMANAIRMKANVVTD
ncbi:MAG: OsmC family protein [Phycisphaerae bacterium]|nr:OsmC family protein [Phycisphaerae bacterium]